MDINQYAIEQAQPAYVQSEWSENISDKFIIKKVYLKPYETRCLWRKPKSERRKRPAVIFIPGSGPQGPESMAPAQLTHHHQDYAFFHELAATFSHADFHVLSVGKPGVEYFHSWNASDRFYDANVLQNLSWSDWINTVKEAILFLKSQETVDENQIFLLGLSEGAHVALDASTREQIAGLFLLSIPLVGMKDLLEWQLKVRPLELRSLLHNEPEETLAISRFNLFPWKEKINPEAMKTSTTENPNADSMIQSIKKLKTYENVFHRNDILEKILSLNLPVWIFHGALDVQVPVSDLIKNYDCLTKKSQIRVKIYDDLGHCFSKPLHYDDPILGSSMGPIDQKFLIDLGSEIGSI